MNQFHDSAVERRVMTPDAVAFLVDLEREFGWRRGRILAAREMRQHRINAGERPNFPPDTERIRADDWMIAPVPPDLHDRRVEITGPVDRKMMINALNSGARVFMADFEDATTPTWDNLMHGHVNLVDAYRGEISLETEDRVYELADDPATLMVRPRGWHLAEKHFLVDGVPMSASLFDFGLYMFHGGREAIAAGSGPYLYLPKLESHHEARFWNDVFVWSQDRLGIPQGTIKATVLIETILAAFEMDEILYELRDHSAGLNAGRWDYIFSLVKKFHGEPAFVLPDRSQVTMTVPFMKAYCDLLVATCHRRGAHAMGGMSAFIPNRRDPAATERALREVEADKAREAEAGFDGTWVAHPDLVPVAMAEFDRILGDRPNQIHRLRDDVEVTAEDLLDLDFPGQVTLEGVRSNVSVGIRYLAAWLAGSGAVALDNLMEDAATAEISRSQIWQWVRHGVATQDGQPVDEALVRSLSAEVVESEQRGPFAERIEEARKVFEEVALGDEFIDFLTLAAYELIN
ncbi:MAG TPA: malate synthase A [Acidimicrobiia bacterium]